MSSIPVELRGRLEAKGYNSVGDFPNVRDAMMDWDSLKSECQFSGPEMNHLKNSIFPAGEQFYPPCICFHMPSPMKCTFVYFSINLFSSDYSMSYHYIFMNVLVDFAIFGTV